MKIFFRRFWVGLLTAGIFCLLIEFLGRGLFFLKHGYTFRQSLAYVPDPDLGWRVNPDHLGRNAFEIHEGFRGKAPLHPKPPGTYRIFCFGGSTTFCGNVSAWKAWPFLLETRLNEGAKGRPFEVMNAGGDGYRIEQSLKWFEKEVRFLEPDAVILHVGWNDIGIFQGQNAFHPLNIGNPQRPLERGLGILVNHSLWFAKWASSFYEGLIKKDRDRAAFQERVLSFEPDFVALEDQLRTFIRLASQEGIDVFILRYPALLMTPPSPQERRLLESQRPSLLEQRPLIDQIYRKILERLERVADEEGIPILDAASPFREIPLAERITLFDDLIHTTEAGNEVIAKTLSEQLKNFKRAGGRR